MQSYFSYLRYSKRISWNYTVTKNSTYLGSSPLHHVWRDTDTVNALKARPSLHSPSKYSKQSRVLQGLQNPLNAHLKWRDFFLPPFLTLGGGTQRTAFHWSITDGVIFRPCFYGVWRDSSLLPLEWKGFITIKADGKWKQQLVCYLAANSSQNRDGRWQPLQRATKRSPM